eukprot:NODE_2531_length_518_cov_18.490405_g2009_i0.p3 GENE.NODE_2531_length_518_cov_18.490405_g2009_i0~~NODE_2531_length_518_cov_18.490405_g2009_i0.p3  ORF type:complete len:53 (-),score=3.29 NODE_2531_length_518_cov_18.490405_g2009_i0:34-192(-)
MTLQNIKTPMFQLEKSENSKRIEEDSGEAITNEVGLAVGEEEVEEVNENCLK